MAEQQRGARMATLAPAEPRDPRVTMVLEVLGGADAGAVAAHWAVDVELLHRWVRGFVAAGSAVVTNRPQHRAAEERDRFLTAFAHELRTPLAVAQVWVELMTGDDLSPALMTRGLAALRDAVGRLAERVADAELLAAASLGRLTVCPERADLADLTCPLPPGAELRAGTGATHVEVDPAMFRRVLRDLWQAAQLPPAPRALRLESEVDGPWVELRVVREADPLDHALLSALFEPFGDENLNSDGTGVTLGLYLARALTVAHGGTIGLEQDDDRLVLWVRLPRSTSMPRSASDHHATTPATPLLATRQGERR